MVKYSNDKKLFLSDIHIFYILERGERSFENIIKIIDKLDAYTLEIKEKVNYKIIRTIFEN
jgi:chromosomal replication initiation ATPase DnaA